MKEKLLIHFGRLNPRRFVICTVAALVVTDLINSWYLRLWWVAKDMSYKGVEMSAARLGGSVSELDPGSINEIKNVFNNGFFFFLFIILANNFFFYAFYLRRKLWAQGFVLFYTLTAAALSGTFLFDNAGLGAGWYAYNLLMIPIYFYLFLGVKILKEQTVDLGEKK